MSDSGRRRGRRAQVLEILRGAAAPLEIAEISRRMGVHPNTVRFPLGSMTQSGRVEKVAREPTGPGRPATAYRPAPRMDPEGPRAYRALAGLLADEFASRPQASRRAVDVGQRWGRRLADDEGGSRARSARAARERMRRMLARLGFAPGVDEDPRRIPLHGCPFLELAEESTRVVCPIHLGLMQGALETWRAPLTVERLEAFAEPNVCLVHLGPAREPANVTS